MVRFLSILVLAACSTPSASPPATPTTPAVTQAPRATVASVVVLELKESCPCTQTRQNASRASFDATLAARATTPAVTVIQMDLEAEKAQFYKDMQEPVVSPAYYFLDATGGLVTFLQGDITGEQFQAALGMP